MRAYHAHAHQRLNEDPPLVDIRMSDPAIVRGLAERAD